MTTCLPSGIPVHDLKVWPEPFGDLLTETKTFEFRKDDRGFQIGDVLLLREWDPETGSYTARELRRRVTYVLRGPAFGVPEGYVIMSVKPEPPVHLLLLGFALCGRQGVPREWPVGEVWVGIPDHRFATCPGCLAVLKDNPQWLPKEETQAHP